MLPRLNLVDRELTDDGISIGLEVEWQFVRVHHWAKVEQKNWCCGYEKSSYELSEKVESKRRQKWQNEAEQESVNKSCDCRTQIDSLTRTRLNIAKMWLNMLRIYPFLFVRLLPHTRIRHHILPTFLNVGPTSSSFPLSILLHTFPTNENSNSDSIQRRLGNNRRCYATQSNQ